MINKIEKIATTEDIQKTSVPVSKAASEMERGDSILRPEDLPFWDSCSKQNADRMDHPTENGKKEHIAKGLTTFSKHKKLRNIKAFLLNKALIKQAIYEARKDKTESKELLDIMSHVDETVERIYNELKAETYKIGKYQFRTIQNHDKKKRHLAILGFYDRCVQQVFKMAVQQKIQNLIPRNTYSNMPHRGTLSNNPTYCLYGQLKHDFRVHPNYYGLKNDIHHCYGSITTDLIKSVLFRYVSDAFARRLVDRMLAKIHSLPVGDPLSGLMVNLVLREYHNHILNEKHHLFKTCYFFCDDSLIIGPSKSDLHELCQHLRTWIPEHLGLYVKNNYKVFPLSSGTVFCGVHIWPHKILMSQATKKRMISKRNNPRSLASYNGIVQKTNSAHLMKTLNMTQKILSLRSA